MSTISPSVSSVFPKIFYEENPKLAISVKNGEINLVETSTPLADRVRSFF